ncbi:MAG: hypothetical protein PHQ34_00545 [Methanothrix sp.]|nr:hypothetical protein [Methanothrix sp.]
MNYQAGIDLPVHLQPTFKAEIELSWSSSVLETNLLHLRDFPWYVSRICKFNYLASL